MDDKAHENVAAGDIYRISCETSVGFMFTDIEAENSADAMHKFCAERGCDARDVVSIQRQDPFAADSIRWKAYEAHQDGSPYTAIAIVAFTIIGFLLGFILARVT